MSAVPVLSSKKTRRKKMIGGRMAGLGVATALCCSSGNLGSGAIPGTTALSTAAGEAG